MTSSATVYRDKSTGRIGVCGIGNEQVWEIHFLDDKGGRCFIRSEYLEAIGQRGGSGDNMPQIMKMIQDKDYPMKKMPTAEPRFSEAVESQVEQPTEVAPEIADPFERIKSLGVAYVAFGTALQNPDTPFRDLAGLAFDAGLQMHVTLVRSFSKTDRQGFR